MSDRNPYAAPAASVGAVIDPGSNTSGLGPGHPLPDGIQGWSWGAFAWGWLWAVFNQTWVGLLCLLPYVGLLMNFYLGFKGREMAWQKKRWDSVEHFNDVQHKWSLWALLKLALVLLGIGAALVLPLLNH